MNPIPVEGVEPTRSSAEQFMSFIEGYRGDNGESKYLDQYLRSKESGKPLVIDFTELFSYSEELAREVKANPREILRHWREGIPVESIHVRNLVEQTPLRLLGSSSMGELISIKGIVVKASQDTSRVSTAVYKCNSPGCGATVDVPQHTQFLMPPPSKCEDCDERNWVFIPERSVYRDSQLINVQEMTEQLSSGETPQKIDVQLLDENVKTCNPGDLIEVTGVINVRQQSPNNFRLDLERYFEANHIEVLNKQNEGLNLSEGELKEIKELSKDEKILQKFIHSVAPSCYGYSHVKEAIVLQLFSSPAIQKSDVRVRGDINVLLVGDPGTFKSQFLKIATSIIPRGVYAIAGRSTKAGLTASLIKDERTGSMEVQAGAAVMADMGICALDEVEKLDKNDRAALHPVMEGQQVSVAMGGKYMTLNARCGWLAAGNPTTGRWNMLQTVAENISLPVTILSRFDLIFIMNDVSDVDKDGSTADRILGIDEEEGELLSREQMRKYISYARTINPVMPSEFKRRIRDYYVGLRKGSLGQAIMITPRQLESIPRLAKAVARARLHERVAEEDLDEALALFKKSMDDVGIDPETGKPDMDALTVGKTKNTQGKMGAVLSMVRKLSGMSIDHRARCDDVKGALMAAGWSSDAYDAIEKAMQRDGCIYYPSAGYMAVTE